ncbi:hypothetical protein HWV23_12780 [Natronomonas halophila]|uniref:hypothetical protein n=1 Tax=Natronomonas halophila TaxID=2747817 RepID=UPI0015B4E5A7|nr:hypothetical protein [Natronomonas halophila]QLD86566.1 hypothetical protein HWV23_12780 [Natronomonas halophila]
MTRRIALRRVVTLLIVTGAATLVVASGGFSANDADRNATVTVVDDSEALLGVQVHGVEVTPADGVDRVETNTDIATSESGTSAVVVFVYEGVPIATVTNRFPAELSVTSEVTTADRYPAIELAGTADTLDIGQQRNVTVDVKCPVVLSRTGDGNVTAAIRAPSETTATVALGVESPEPDTTGELSRETTVECSPGGDGIDTAALPVDPPGLQHPAADASENVTGTTENRAI